MKVPHLSLSGRHSLIFYIKSKNIDDKKFNVKVSYKLGSEKSIACTKEEVITIQTVNPFDVQVKYLSSLLEHIVKCYVGEDFAVMPVLKCLSPWPVIIENTSLEFVTFNFYMFPKMHKYFYRFYQYVILKQGLQVR